MRGASADVHHLRRFESRALHSTAMWQPLVTDERRATILTRIGELVAAVDAAPVRDHSDHADRAVLRSYLAQDDLVPDPDDAAGQALGAAIASMAGTGLMLFGGITGTGWTVAHLAGGEVADRVCAVVDEAALRSLRTWTGDYDLIRGVVGLGVYAVERGDAGAPIALCVLDVLERTAVPRAGGLAWHTSPAQLVDWQRAATPQGYWNLGLAHGIPGVVALLARFLVNAIDPPRTRRLLDGALAYLMAAEPARAFPSWHVGPVDDPAVHRDAPPTGRLAWCYGDLGVALALLAAAQATGDSAIRADACTIARACAERAIADAHVHEGGICHGALGAAHLFARLHHATREAHHAEAALRWLDHGLALHDPVMHADPSVLVGAAGAALVLHAMVSHVDPAWDRRLLIDLAD